MCGFVGFLGGDVDDSVALALLKSMTDQIAQRGPNDSGVWSHTESRIWLGHRRLSILDLSPAGHQPMLSDVNRYVIAFNGEIYNHLDIRDELTETYKAPSWRGHSDTETLLAAIEAWGVDSALKKCVGMFAFSLWDRESETLTLARDRMGEKPLYYGWQERDNKKPVFIFGSDLKALKVHPNFSGNVDREALCLFLRYNYIPAPYSIYQNIFKLEPGCLLTVSLTHPEPEIYKYWDMTDVVRDGQSKPFLGSADDAVNALEKLAKKAISLQMIADVPYGAFMSGGIDSSTVVALMQSQSATPIKTFTLGYKEDGYSEAESAKKVAKYLGTDHTELYVSAEDALKVIPILPNVYSEPFADSSQIPTFLVSQLAKQHVTVSLSGDAGDELFCGYNRYQMTEKIWPSLSKVPLSMRKVIANRITAIKPQTLNNCLAFLPWVSVGDKLHKGANAMARSSVKELYLSMVSSWDHPSELVIGGVEPAQKLQDEMLFANNLSDVQQMMLLDTLSYLPDDILVKVDRAAMANSLESRIPFLDHRIVEFAWQLPMEYKLYKGQTKWVLRQVLQRYVPRELIERPKMGFGFPIDIWLRGPLRDWAENLLSEERLRNEGFFHPEPIREKWLEHLSGSRNWSSKLWAILMFQAWLELEGCK